jgi:hypothetical protein
MQDDRESGGQAPDLDGRAESRRQEQPTTTSVLLFSHQKIFPQELLRNRSHEQKTEHGRDRTCNLLIRSQAPCHWATHPLMETTGGSTQ